MGRPATSNRRLAQAVVVVVSVLIAASLSVPLSRCGPSIRPGLAWSPHEGAFRPQGKVAVLGGGGEYRVIDLEGGSTLRRVKVPNAPVRALCADARHVVLCWPEVFDPGSLARLELWELGGAGPLLRYELGPREAWIGSPLAISADAGTIAAANSDELLVFGSRRPQVAGRFETGLQEPLSGLALSEGGNLAAAWTHTGTLLLWDVGTGSELARWTGLPGDITAIAAASPGRAAVAFASGQIAVYDVGSGRPTNLGLRWRVIALAFSADARDLHVLSPEGKSLRLVINPE